MMTAGDGFTADPVQIRSHAGNVEAINDGFDAVTTASSYISRDESAYGLLCGWIAGVLEGRHRRQDELFADVAENLSLVAEQLRRTADGYEQADAETDDLIRRIGTRLDGRSVPA